MIQNPVVEKSFAFSVRIVRLYRYLANSKKEYILSRQICRSGTSIGANISEAQRALSRADFAARMGIALKEANETHYWLKLLCSSGFLTETEFRSMNRDLDELLRLLTAICKKISVGSK